MEYRVKIAVTRNKTATKLVIIIRLYDLIQFTIHLRLKVTTKTTTTTITVAIATTTTTRAYTFPLL